MTAKHPMIPFPVIVRAADGDIDIVEDIKESSKANDDQSDPYP